WGGRFGNEGRVGQPATIVRVRRQRPDPPVPPPPDSDRVYASPADYHGHSYYTYRWQPQPGLKTHVYRALDDAVIKADFARRRATPATLSTDDEQLFPVDWRGPDPSKAAKRQQLANELNALNGHASLAEALPHYGELSNDALLVLAGL